MHSEKSLATNGTGIQSMRIERQSQMKEYRVRSKERKKSNWRKFTLQSQRENRPPQLAGGEGHREERPHQLSGEVQS